MARKGDTHPINLINKGSILCNVMSDLVCHSLIHDRKSFAPSHLLPCSYHRKLVVAWQNRHVWKNQFAHVIVTGGEYMQHYTFGCSQITSFLLVFCPLCLVSLVHASMLTVASKFTTKATPFFIKIMISNNALPFVSRFVCCHRQSTLKGKWCATVITFSHNWYIVDGHSQFILGILNGLLYTFYA